MATIVDLVLGVLSAQQDEALASADAVAEPTKRRGEKIRAGRKVQLARLRGILSSLPEANIAGDLVAELLGKGSNKGHGKGKHMLKGGTHGGHYNGGTSASHGQYNSYSYGMRHGQNSSESQGNDAALCMQRQSLEPLARAEA